MSVIGTTHKQPRVFAHDAIALKDLPQCVYRLVTKIELIDPRKILPGFKKGDITIGSGFLEGEIYTAVLDGSIGTNVRVEIGQVDSNGGIISCRIVRNDCSTKGHNNSNLSQGDILSILWSPKDKQGFSDGSSALNYLRVAGLENSEEWDYGCPFVNLLTRQNDLERPATKTPSAYRRKDLIIYGCGDCDFVTPGPGAGIYVGYDLTSIELVMESGKKVTYNNVPAGSFMPVSALTVCSAEAAGPIQDRPDAQTLKSLILALF